MHIFAITEREHTRIHI